MHDPIISHRPNFRAGRTWLAAGMLALLAAACSGASGGAVETGMVRRGGAEYRFYEVTGSDAESIARSLDEGSRRLDGRRAMGVTHWDVRWQARWASRGALCRVTGVDVQLRIQVVLPLWERPPGASEELAREWDAFIAALSRHEAGHVDLAAAAGREVRGAISRVTAPNCALMDARTRAEGERVLRDYAERQRGYDERTRRGASQGVAWPPRRRSGEDATDAPE